ncbi:39S ribosomal protein L23, mitochondrial isoform X1 [Ischnura elegans]|uniref:39S ribosomal protein L23, mitochondrial isoform X1 n=1 Tax=Ischnura elegans TaxID=197161 RepID=UPI001ED8814C|nr:39S ribosomal protein L23, mitochondrial isoform X1 [Ischnura elegans]
MSTRWYPLYQKGNPQLRVFLPNFWMKLVKPKFSQPPNVVKFKVSMEMTKRDVRNYLEKIYKIPVVEVRTQIELGPTKREPLKGYIVKDEDVKVAYVVLPREVKFEFPNIFPKSEEEKRDEELKKIGDLKDGYNKFIKRNEERKDLPGWFSI